MDLCESLNRLRRAEHLCDFALVCRGRRHPCHAVVLASRSEFLRKIIAEDGKSHLVVDDEFSDCVEDFLDLCYGVVLKSHLSVGRLMKVYEMTAEFGATELQEKARGMLKKKVHARNQFVREEASKWVIIH